MEAPAEHVRLKPGLRHNPAPELHRQKSPESTAHSSSACICNDESGRRAGPSAAHSVHGASNFAALGKDEAPHSAPASFKRRSTERPSTEHASVSALRRESYEPHHNHHHGHGHGTQHHHPFVARVRQLGIDGGLHELRRKTPSLPGLCAHSFISGNVSSEHTLPPSPRCLAIRGCVEGLDELVASAHETISTLQTASSSSPNGRHNPHRRSHSPEPKLVAGPYRTAPDKLTSAQSRTRARSISAEMSPKNASYSPGMLQHLTNWNRPSSATSNVYYTPEMLQHLDAVAQSSASRHSGGRPAMRPLASRARRSAWQS